MCERRATPATDRVWKYVDCRGDDECWLWLGAKNSGGYGVVAWGERGCRTSSTAHRVVYMLVNSTISEGFIVRHTCGTPACCNPKHLVLGTRIVNMLDCVRGASPAKSHRFAPRHRKLTDAAVREIRRVHEEGYTRVCEIAFKFGVSESTVYNICNGVRKSHVI